MSTRRTDARADFPIEVCAILTFSLGLIFKFAFLISMPVIDTVAPNAFWGGEWAASFALFDAFAVSFTLAFMWSAWPLLAHFSGLRRYDSMSVVASFVTAGFALYLLVALYLLYQFGQEYQAIADAIDWGWFSPSNSLGGR